MSERAYSSPLRDQQAQRTRELILDALTELLGDHSPSEITTRAIAERAGVSQPTVYRHFPDRHALLEGLAERIMPGEDFEPPATLDEFLARAIPDMAAPEANVAAATAEALLNADPRRLSSRSRVRSEVLQRLVAEAFPEYSERDHVRIAALFRLVYSIQAWLRMREEFGVPGAESGPVVAWALQTLAREIRAGNFPRSDG